MYGLLKGTQLFVLTCIQVTGHCLGHDDDLGSITNLGAVPVGVACMPKHTQ